MALASGTTGQTRTLLAVAAQTCRPGEMGVANWLQFSDRSIFLVLAFLVAFWLQPVGPEQASLGFGWVAGISTQLDISGHRCRRFTPLVLRDRRAGQITKIRPTPVFQTQECIVRIWLPDMGQHFLFDGVWRHQSFSFGVFPALVLRQRSDWNLVV